ncbi:RsmB/NOP family class I SAM-dependent RNA methyltransferase [Aetokthonos hydrillicola Thurmond2011]|jgi:16S rRNA C967 or C1407 C5-methylase (RsmB/RsmF family)|uniref:RsmB/NOP family class I SAM-dependent RNA methyltransferase n=1 Tax=Aetokthonos hydrillicola Thurmond2011 TaxID=2712845 RepID=A0AAP5I5K5_9CYAN|nr:RsmB/NOP family class I SAM-dependent RNA methyltransferase [Aetokthonos hydrillicola]MBO3459493.1 RsmB/NOP family class I SAM-dependent RNA methyltransferase [Aetokthonos hydrillicola CCALA 1050]MBW4583856.1 RsmB/NOP family class I SAM-dependent RNA methyltransferase [Aetokthonos hydrillicola CCALA 1050]MDR9895447.1 RsmB/NOP family class I SAM-dependent RNA methyltransferase [Aetokthonos hydrillicola Thurmond2011]
MNTPSNLLIKLSRRLFENLNEQERFVEALTNPQPFHPCILWGTEKPEIPPFQVEAPSPWQPNFIDRLSLGQKPGQHPLHEKGNFYCLDFSSVFAASTLLTISDHIDLVLDMCAAPGGKSIFAWKNFHPDLLISNEVIGKRLGMLISNFKRCHIKPSIIVNRDSSILAEIMASSSHLAIVDAPCTGQSLLAKGEKAPGCFHPTAINKSANRQKRIIANSAKIVAPQGYLAYMTCTYSPEENEQVSEWFLERFTQFQAVEINHLKEYQSHLTTIPCYRMFPQDRLGAGAFTVLFKNTDEGEVKEVNMNLLSGVWTNILEK